MLLYGCRASLPALGDYTSSSAAVFSVGKLGFKCFTPDKLVKYYNT